ncbi:hypothetical protein NQ315_008032 [Exocentrus adspersus]|uniref:Tetratricopeptide repeat protein 29 n=1 Tax=Exocentrus adspersus TaxID=1586481 RepID=A0AAV8VVS8_9CUCU|nr:hypothetical protein NQ315_008032 [Exocentrus adspersus]
MELNENYIRRERQRRAETKRTIAEMRAALKVCTVDDVRYHKMPFNEALLIGLEEKGYYITAAFIHQLIDFQSEMTEKAGPTSVLWTKPQLKDTKNILKVVSESLMEAEDFRKVENYEKECETFLKIATHIAFLNTDWWWLGEQLLLQSIAIAKDYPSSGGKYEALSRYAYAKFLIENIRETAAAYEHLQTACNLSASTKWTTCGIFPEETGLLFANANYLLHICLMQQAKSYFKIDNSKAIELATLARKRAADACNKDAETRALILKGICEINSNLPQHAIATFTKASYIQQKMNNVEGICETRLQLARAYLMNGDTLNSLKTLTEARDVAKHNDLGYYLAQAYKHLGEFHLNNGEPKKATPLLGESLKILHEGQYIKENEQVRNLEAISTGLELFPKYIDLLSSVSDPVIGNESLMKMIDWKDSRERFWDSDDESDEPSAQLSDTPDEEEAVGEETAKSSVLDEEMEENGTNKDIIELLLNINAFRPDSDTNVPSNPLAGLIAKKKHFNG